MSGDPLADILKLAEAEPVSAGGFSAGGKWALRFPPPDRIKFLALAAGECWFTLEGRRTPLRMRAGDVVVVSAGRAFTLASDPAVRPQEARTVFAGRSRGFVKIGRTEECLFLGGHVRLDPRSGRLFEDLLPSLVHVRASHPQAATLRWLIDQLIAEVREARPASALAEIQLTRLLFIQVLRLHLATEEGLHGRFRALVDPRLLPALRLMHGNPARPWALSELARAAAMSRTSFAVYFKRITGITPIGYLTSHRMALAEKSLRDDSASVAELAETLGYASQAAFSNAFKRVRGMSPLHYRLSARQKREQAAA